MTWSRPWSLRVLQPAKWHASSEHGAPSSYVAAEVVGDGRDSDESHSEHEFEDAVAAFVLVIHQSECAHSPDHGQHRCRAQGGSEEGGHAAGHWREGKGDERQQGNCKDGVEDVCQARDGPAVDDAEQSDDDDADNGRSNHGESCFVMPDMERQVDVGG